MAAAHVEGGARWLASGVIGISVLTVALADTAPGSGARDPQVELRLVVDESGDHVLGDRIPVLWRFTNRSSWPVGFLWEGCCRLNGRLNVSEDDRVVAVIPAGQALAHMFAKAERLDPGISRDFETTLADWVQLMDSGTFKLGGSYIGVLPTQRPQLPRGLNLWTHRAESQSVNLRVLSIRDYLGQRVARENASQLRAILTGPGRIDPLHKLRYQVTLQNLTATNENLRWPDAASIWVVRPNGERCAASGLRFVSGPREITLSAGGGTNLNFEIDANSMEGEPFGLYNVFVDLRKGDEKKLRTPSNPQPLSWELAENEVHNLLVAAALGGRTGARNAPLKLLRTHLRQIHKVLQALSPGTNWSTQTLDLLAQLSRASQLTAMPARQGRISVGIRFDALGKPAWTDPLLNNALPLKDGWIQGLKDLLQIRKHLGWGVSLALFPDDVTPLSLAVKLAMESSQFAQELADSPVLRLDSSSPEDPPETVTIQVVDTAFRSQTFMIVTRRAGAVEARVIETAESVEAPDPSASSPPSREASVRSPQELKTILHREFIAARAAVVIADPDLRWDDLKPWIRALTDVGVLPTLRLQSAGK